MMTGCRAAYLAGSPVHHLMLIVHLEKAAVWRGRGLPLGQGAVEFPFRNSCLQGMESDTFMTPALAECPGGTIHVVTNHGGFRMTGASKRLHAALIAIVVCGCTVLPDPPAPQSSCGSDDPRVGQIAELTNRFIHNVSGTARIINNCTIEIDNFTYDGLALDARVVGVKNNDYAHVTVLTGKLRAYNDETLMVPLPEGVTLDDVPTISISCVGGTVAFGNGNLGEGVFHAP